MPMTEWNEAEADPGAILEEPPPPPAPVWISPGDPDSFRAGERAAVERVFRAFWPRLYRVAYRVLLTHDDAEEAAQEGFVRAHAARAGFRGATGDELGAWLAAITRNVALDSLRRSGKRHELPENAAAPASADPQGRLDARETCREVRSALESLEPGDRAAIVLFEVEELPQAEIAAGMKITVGALKVRLHRARRRFREAYLKIVNSRGREGEIHG